ncbi:cytochrome c oxidase assembly protein [Anaerobacillus sp. MEB173]|uniref:cytochrome c oxidase assembly protein n=1 Tax=Anaerobacillus sp. MEB173 TaxID=3383345 RepID=UPI003F922800
MGNESMANNHVHVVASFSELWSPGWILFSVFLLLSYLMIITKYRDRFADAEPVPMTKILLFSIGVILLYIAKGSPLSYYGHHYLFSAHMTQMSIAYLIVPPLFLYGLPSWVIRPIVNYELIKKPFEFFTKPLIAIILFNGLFSIYHYPFVFNAIMSSPVLHVVVHIILMFAAFIMWWPILCPLPEQETLTPLKKVGYIFADGVLLTPACALIIFAGTVLYDPYLSAPQLISALPIIEDQQLGGVIMKIVQEIVYGSILAYIFVGWFKRERKEEDMEYERISNHTEPKTI